MKPPDASTLLKRARGAANLSQRDLAKKARTSQSVVARIELGTTNPTWTTLSRLMRAAGCEIVAEVRRPPVVDPSVLDDIPRILRLTPEERLLEVAHVSRFMANVQRA